VLYTHRDSDNIGFISREENNLIKNSQLTATGGFNWQAGQAWEVEASGSYGRNDLHRLSNSILFGTNGALINDVLFEVGAAEVKADGPTYALPGGDMYMAIGAGWRSESLKSVPSFANGTGNPGNPLDFDQTVRSVFGEVLIPIIGPANHSGGVERLELSLAGRYDDYSRFGSSFDPRAGLLWEPKRGLRLRGSYGTSFAAPKLADYNLASTRGFAIVQPDPLGPGGVSRQLLLLGTDVAGLGPQQSKSWSVGIEVEPERITGLQFGMNYYNIRYRDRIAAPQPTTVILANPASFGSLFIRDPSLAQINEYIALAQLGGNPLFALFDPTTVDAIVDGRRRNLSATATSGLDFSAQYTFAAGESEFNFGLNATYIFELEQQITEASAPFDSVATYFNPPHARARSAVGWHRQSWSANMFVNYTDSYTDNRFETMPVPVSSYTTVDLRVAYESGEGIRSDFWSGVSVSLNAQNLFDQDPPRTAIIRPDSDSGFDPTNANPLGRFVAIELVKKW
jgi:outer membrane receptor protein involved in Fe transport